MGTIYFTLPSFTTDFTIVRCVNTKKKEAERRGVLMGTEDVIYMVIFFFNSFPNSLSVVYLILSIASLIFKQYLLCSIPVSLFFIFHNFFLLHLFIHLFSSLSLTIFLSLSSTFVSNSTVYSPTSIYLLDLFLLFSPLHLSLSFLPSVQHTYLSPSFSSSFSFPSSSFPLSSSVCPCPSGLG